MQQAKNALRDLQKLRILERLGKDRWRVLDVALSSRSSQTSLDKNHLAKLDLMRGSVLVPDPEMIAASDVSSYILSIDRKKLPEAKQRILRFRRKLAKFLDSGEKSGVYLIYIHMMPVAKLPKR